MSEYRITTVYNKPLADTDNGLVIRKTLPSAWAAYERAVYDAVKRRAGLDTVWGNVAMDRAESGRGETAYHYTPVQDLIVTFKRVD